MVKDIVREWNALERNSGEYLFEVYAIFRCKAVRGDGVGKLSMAGGDSAMATIDSGWQHNSQIGDSETQQAGMQCSGSEQRTSKVSSE